MGHDRRMPGARIVKTARLGLPTIRRSIHDAAAAMSTDFAATWAIYTAAWKAGTDDERQALLDRAVHADCHYADPLVQVEGHRPLSAYMADLQRQVPGVHFVTQRFIVHHGRSMAQWQMRDGVDRVVGEGVSFGEYAEDGRLRRMTGFFDLPPAA